MASREFHLGDILSVTGDKLVSPRLIDGVYDIMGFLTGQTLWTHQLVVMHGECRRELLRQHPDLEAIDDSTVTRENAFQWLDMQIAKYGEKRLVSPILFCEQRDPLSDLIGMVGKDKVTVIEP